MDQLLIDLFQAYFKARKHKRNKTDVLEFELNYEREILKLYREIKNGNYKISPSAIFIIFDPVQREVIAPSFRDRIVHHLIFDYINPIFERKFIYDSYSCRKNKGTLFGLKRINKFIKIASNNYQQNIYVLKLDISGYFANINKEVLWIKIKKVLLKNKDKCYFNFPLILSLIKTIIFFDYTKNYIILGRYNDWKGLPKNKSLFYAKNNRGLPIGNLSSQLFSNIYLNSLDYFIKRNLGFRFYGRYVDDFVLIGYKEELKKSIFQIKNYLKTVLGLEINQKKVYLKSFEKGLNFLGAVIKPYRTYIGNRTKTNFYFKIRKINKEFKMNDFKKNKNRSNLLSLNSYLGLSRHYNTFKLRNSLLNKLSGDNVMADKNFFKIGFH